MLYRPAHGRMNGANGPRPSASSRPGWKSKVCMDQPQPTQRVAIRQRLAHGVRQQCRCLRQLTTNPCGPSVASGKSAVGLAWVRVGRSLARRASEPAARRASRGKRSCSVLRSSHPKRPAVTLAMAGRKPDRTREPSMPSFTRIGKVLCKSVRQIKVQSI